MLETRMLDPNFSATGQLGVVDVAEAARLGFKTVICNRPDGEGGTEQPSSEENRKAAEKAGLTYHYLPMTPDTLSMELLEQFRQALEDSPKPVLAHCKSGARSTLLWALVQCCHKDGEIDGILQRAEKEGYDLWKAKPLIERYMQAHQAG